MNRMNKLNHFTTFEVLLKILKEGMKFSNPSKWKDKNDTELVELYKEIKSLKKIGIACFMQDDETIFHWMAFSKNRKIKDVCCIEFDKEKLLKCLQPQENYIYQSIQYETLNDVSFDEPEELLFTKRWPYRNEKEFRIVQLINRRKIDVKSAIRKITLGPKPLLSYDDFCERSDILLKISGLKCDINQSTILENETWISKAKLLKLQLDRNDVTIKDAKDYTEKEKCDIKKIVEKGENVGMQKFDDIWNNGSIVATVFKEKKLLACGALKVPFKDNKKDHKWNVFKSAGLDEKYCSTFQYELGWIVTEPGLRGRGFCSAIVKKLLEYNGEKPIYATVRQHNFTMRKILEIYGFCVVGIPYHGNGDYNVLLYVKNV